MTTTNGQPRDSTTQRCEKCLRVSSPRCPDNLSELRGKLITARDDVNDMDELVEEHSGQEIDKPSRARLNRSLNEIQANLEALSSAIGFGDLKGETQWPT